MAVTPMSLPPPGLGTGSAWSAEVSLGSGHRAQAHATRRSQQQAALTASRGIEATSPVRQAWLSTPHGGDKGSRAWLRETPRTPAGHRGVGSLRHCHVAGPSLWSPAPCGQRSLAHSPQLLALPEGRPHAGPWASPVPGQPEDPGPWCPVCLGVGATAGAPAAQRTGLSHRQEGPPAKAELAPPASTAHRWAWRPHQLCPPQPAMTPPAWHPQALPSGRPALSPAAAM